MIDPVSAAAIPKLTGAQAAGAQPAQAVEKAVRAFASDLAQAEAMSVAGLAGQAGPREVADAVMQAERSLQTAIAVRDKIVSSFLEISRMAI